MQSGTQVDISELALKTLDVKSFGIVVGKLDEKLNLDDVSGTERVPSITPMIGLLG